VPENRRKWLTEELCTSYVYIDSLDPSLVLQGGQAPRLIYLYRGAFSTKSYGGEDGEDLLSPYYPSATPTGTVGVIQCSAAIGSDGDCRRRSVSVGGGSAGGGDSGG
jgi:hypothetical protein